MREPKWIKAILEELSEEEKPYFNNFLQSIKQIKSVSDVGYDPCHITFFISFDICMSIKDKDIKIITESYKNLLNYFKQKGLDVLDFKYEIGFSEVGGFSYSEEIGFTVFADLVISTIFEEEFEI